MFDLTAPNGSLMVAMLQLLFRPLVLMLLVCEFLPAWTSGLDYKHALFFLDVLWLPPA